MNLQGIKIVIYPVNCLLVNGIHLIDHMHVRIPQHTMLAAMLERLVDRGNENEANNAQ